MSTQMPGVPTWVKQAIFPLLLGALLNFGRMQNCHASNEERSVTREILLRVPEQTPAYQEFLEETALPLIEQRDCGVLPF